MDPLIWASLIGAGGGIAQQFMGGGSSVSDSKRLMYNQQLYWNDRFKAQKKYTKGMLRNYGPEFQVREAFREKMRLGKKYGIHPLAMLRGGGGSAPPPSIIAGQPTAGGGIPTSRKNAPDLQRMGQDLGGLIAKILDPERKLDIKLKQEELKQEQIRTKKMQSPDRGEYDYIGGGRGEPAEAGKISIGKPIAGDQAIKTSMGRIKIIPAEILGEAYDASPFQKAKGFMEEAKDLLGLRRAWKSGHTAANSSLVKKQWRIKEWLHEYLKVPNGKDVRIDGSTGTWYIVKSRQRKLWLNKRPWDYFRRWTP